MERISRLILSSIAAAILMLPSVLGGQWTVRGPDRFGANLWGVTHGLGGFYAVGTGGTIGFSVDGDNWKTRHIEPNDWLFGVGIGGDQLVAVGRKSDSDAGVIWTSTDGLRWQRRLDSAKNGFTRVTFGAGRFVAVGGAFTSGDGVAAVSTNGFSWTTRAYPFPVGPFQDVIFVHDHFLNTSLTGVYQSADGLAWNKAESALVSLGRDAPNGLAHRGSLVVTAARFGAISYSEDQGLTWTNAIASFDLSFLDVAAAPNLFMAIGSRGRITTSTDGRTWTNQNSGSSAELLEAAYGDGVWIVVGDRGTVLKSTNAVTWTAISKATPRFTDIAFGAGKFVATSAEAMMISDDGMNWTYVPEQGAESVAFGNGRFVASGKDFITSTDGLTWTAVTNNLTPLTGEIAYGGGRFMAVGGVNALNYPSSWARTSFDGITWSSVPVPTIGKLSRLTFVGDEFFASSLFYNQGVVLGATNLDNSRTKGVSAFGPERELRLEADGYVSVGAQNSQVSLAHFLIGGDYAGGRYIVFGDDSGTPGYGPSVLWVSDNGHTWRNLSPPTVRGLRAAAAGNGHLVVVGDGIIIERALDNALLERPDLQVIADGLKFGLSWFSRQGHVYQLQSSLNGVDWKPFPDAATGLPFNEPGTGGRLLRFYPFSENVRLFRVMVSPE